MTDATFDMVFDTAKPIFLLEVINTITEAAKVQIERLQDAFKKRAQNMQEMASSLSKLGKNRKSNNYATAQSEAYEAPLSSAEIAALLAQTTTRKNGLDGKGGSGSRSL